MSGLPSTRCASVRTVPLSPLTKPRIPRDKAADIVAEAAVPFLPAVADESPDLIETGGVPGLGDQLGTGEIRIRLDVPRGRGIFERAAAFIPGQDCGEVEAEPVDMHLGNPVAQAVEDHAAHDRLIGVQRVPG